MSHPELRLHLAGGAGVSLCLSVHHADLQFLKRGFWLWTGSVVFYKITCFNYETRPVSLALLC